MLRNKRKTKLLNVPFQKKVLFLIFLSAVIPTAIVAVCLYYLIFNMLAWQIGIPEAIAYNLMPVVRKVNFILLIGLPVSLVVIWLIALELSHRIAGPLYRLERELEEIIAGKKHEPIKVRSKDELKSLVDKINKFLGR